MTRWLLIAALLCGFAGGAKGAGKAWPCYYDQHTSGQALEMPGQLGTLDTTQRPQLLLQPVPQLQSIASSRPVRQLPTHGSKPGHHPCQGAGEQLSNPFKYLSLLRHQGPKGQGAPAASPRLLYVIALRRLLC